MSTEDKKILANNLENYKTRVNKISVKSKLDNNIYVNSEYSKDSLITKKKYNDLSDAIYRLEGQLSNNCCQSTNYNCCQKCQSYSCQSISGNTCQSYSCQSVIRKRVHYMIGTAIEGDVVFENFYNECPTPWQCWDCFQCAAATGPN